MKNTNIFVFCFLILSISFNCNAQKKQKVKPTKSKKYNVLFIAVDDLNDWVGFLDGNPQTLTPNMDRLAKQSMVFERAYCAASVCNPSRAAIMSGLKPSTTKIYGNTDKAFASPVFKNTTMLPQYFANNGYETYSRGKIYHTPAIGKETWSNWENVTGNYGQAKKVEGYLSNGIPVGEIDEHMDWAATNQKTEETPDFLNAKWAAGMLEKGFDKPFFLACGIFRPHLEWNVPKEFYDKFPLDKIVLPTVLENDLDDVGEQAKPSKDYLAIKKYGKQKEAVQAYLACVNYADYCIGQMLDALEKSKYKDNTIVVLWGDHGWHLGEKLRYKKFTLWEEACRVPLIIKAPNVTKAGSRTGRTVNLLDLYPTLVELTGLPKNQKNEGVSIVPLLKNSKKEWNYPSLTQMGEGRNTIRTEKWRYIRYKDNTEELYNHEVDALEWVNLANKPEYAIIKNELEKELSKILKNK